MGKTRGRVAKKRADGGVRLEATPAAFEQACGAQNFGEARRIIERIIRNEPNWVEARICHAQILFEHFGEVERPLEILQQLAQRVRAPKIHSLLATLYFSVNQKEEAIAAAEACLSLRPEMADAYQTLQRAQPERAEELRNRIEFVLATRHPTPQEQLIFHATLGRIAEKEGDYARAFHAFAQANALRPGRYDPAEINLILREMTRTIDTDFIASRRSFGASDGRPVFVLGMPRSGSTLLERILSQHPRIDTAGERTELNVIAEELRRRLGAPPLGRAGGVALIAELSRHDARAAGGRYVELVRPALKRPTAARWIDKMPGNFMLVGLIKTILPQAKILHARRNPLDVAASCFTQSFRTGHAYAQSLERLAHYLVFHRRLTAHWRSALGEAFHEIDYERVVADLDGESRRALSYLGLDWDPACLAPQESDRPVLTASVAQVREPVYRGSVGRWRRYEAQMAPLFDAWRAMGDDVYRDMRAAADSD